MNQTMAVKMFGAARAYCDENYADELDWANSISPKTFKNLKSKHFLSEYGWVVYASGFKVSTIEATFPKLRVAFKEFDIDALSRMRSIKSALTAFNNERKATSFLEGSKQIAKEGFSTFKKRLKEDGVDALEHLPGIGPITKYHLAKNIGLADEAKPDIWLVRAAEACSTTVQELVSFLREEKRGQTYIIDNLNSRIGDRE